MPQRDDVGVTSHLDCEARRGLLRANCGADVQVTSPNAFAKWMGSLKASEPEAASVKIQRGAADLGCFDPRVKRSFPTSNCGPVEIATEAGAVRDGTGRVRPQDVTSNFGRSS
jgi:hypothetical protein